MDEDNISDNEEEKPQVVVIKSGDLTAEEAEREKNRIDIGNIILINFRINTYLEILFTFIVTKCLLKTKLNILFMS